MRIESKDTVALVIDFQEKLMPAIYEKDEIIKNSAILIQGLTTLQIPLIVTQQYTKGLGDTVADIKNVIQPFHYIDKITFSCYQNEQVKQELEKLGRKNVLLLGTEAHICVLQTLIDLQQNGYQAVLVEDCVSSRRKKDKKTSLFRAQKEGAIITSYESVLFEMAQISGTPEFKMISKLVK